MLAALAALAPLAARAEAAADALRAGVEAGRLDALRWPRFPDHLPALRALYARRGFAPIWLADAQPTPQASEAIDELGAAAVHGLDPRDYDAAALAAQLVRLRDTASPAPPDARARFDLALSVSLLRLLSDLHVGRVPPAALHFRYAIEARRYDAAVLLALGVAEGRIREVVRAAQPPLAQNRLLEEQLARYRALAVRPDAAPPAIRPTWKPGAASAAVPALARWLVALGDLPADAPIPETYDGALVDAVRRFQIRHGLASDGVIGPQTTRALGVPLEARVRQLELALERLRWIPELGGGRAVFVNVPAFELLAYDAIGSPAAPALQLAVVVGRAARSETPLFAAAMNEVVFAPYWNVPASIVRGEIAPKLRRNPGYLAAQGMEVVSAGSVLGDGPAAIAALASGRTQVRQRPGPKNALGRVKFLFPNRSNVYLHDTPSQGLFRQARRDFSHGCVRVSAPAALAEWVLRPQGWNAVRVAEGLAATRETRVAIEEPIPVVLYYATAVAHRDGTISFYTDIYGHDAALERALARGRPYAE
jgi:murein L,D-transpeptidase YcbB/YkuD